MASALTVFECFAIGGVFGLVVSVLPAVLARPRIRARPPDPPPPAEPDDVWSELIREEPVEGLRGLYAERRAHRVHQPEPCDELTLINHLLDAIHLARAQGYPRLADLLRLALLALVQGHWSGEL